jgi:acyl-[acyl-carrier-protein]-phospholipid O-acyltransferase/long-chain-fatty-acid--[acyl-carrier-protein] ligase
VIFSSGSTGTPKGVQLTHRQLLANFSAILPHLGLEQERDILLSPLPLFHSFGYAVGTFFPLCTGLGIAAHPDPTDALAIGKLAAMTKASFLVSTATFVRGYLRRISPEQFASLRFAVVGAEKCPQDLRERFRDRYQAELYEGYGATELAPVVSVNHAHHVRDGVHEQGCKEGSVGRPMPGIDVVTMDPDTRELLPPGHEGLLVVRSPARMLGYLNQPERTDDAFVHDGYDTGDMGYVDDDGFVHITGRLARFAKIGGEMVPLEQVQEHLAEACRQRIGESNEHVLAVSSAPDPSRGERVVVLHDGLPLSAEEIAALGADLPPLFRPRSRDVHQVDAIPMLGTGKLDLRGLKDLAEQAGA